MPVFIFEKDTLVSVNGCHTARFLGQIEREVPEIFRKAALASGGTLVGATPKAKPAKRTKKVKKENPEVRKAKIAEAVTKLLDCGDISVLTPEGVVRVGAIEAALGFAVTEEERDEASKTEEV